MRETIQWSFENLLGPSHTRNRRIIEAERLMPHIGWECYRVNEYYGVRSRVQSTMLEGAALGLVRGTTNMISVRTRVEITVCSRMSDQLGDLKEAECMPVKDCR